MMSGAKRASKRKRRNKAVVAAGLSLSLASGASAAFGATSADSPAQKAAVGHEVTLAEEEMCDVSLATFYVFDRERDASPRSRARLAFGGACGCGGMGCGGCGCWTGTDYSSSIVGGATHAPQHPAKPAVKKPRQSENK